MCTKKSNNKNIPNQTDKTKTRKKIPTQIRKNKTDLLRKEKTKWKRKNWRKKNLTNDYAWWKGWIKIRGQQIFFWKQLGKCYWICSLELQECDNVWCIVVTDWFYTALSRLWQSSARLEIWLNALWKISVLVFFSPYSYYINLFLSCLVIKRTTPHFDSAPVHNGSKYFCEVAFEYNFWLRTCLSGLR